MTTNTYAASIPTDHAEWTEDYANGVVAAYVAADKGNKATIRAAWQKVFYQAVDDMDVTAITFTRELGKRLTVTKNVDSVTDPIVAYRVRFMALSEAAIAVRAEYIESRKVTDGDDFNIDDVTMAFDNLELSKDDATACDTMRDKLATVSGVNRRTGDNRSIIGHVKFCLDNAPAGNILTSRQISLVYTDDYPVTDSASEGAIGAYWKRATDSETRDKSAQPGIRYTVNEKGVRGFQLVTD